MQYKDTLLIYGGISLDRDEDLTKIYQYSFANNTYTTISTNNKINWNNFSFCKLSNRQLLIYGGINNKNREIVGDVKIWDLEINKFIEPFIAGESPGKRKGHAMVIYKRDIKKEILTIGGVGDVMMGMEIHKVVFYSK